MTPTDTIVYLQKFFNIDLRADGVGARHYEMRI